MSSLRRHPRLALILGATLAGIPLIVALAGPLVAEPGERGPAYTQGENWLLGTDVEGRDVLSQVLLGGRSLVVIAVIAVVLTYAVAVPWAITAATSRHRLIDEMMMRPLDVLLSLPSIMLLLIVVAMSGASTVVLTVTVALLLFPDAARLIRASALRAVHTPAMQALILQRESWWRRMIGYLGRTLVPIIAADAGLRFVGAIYLVASASFLGLTADAAGTDWAVMVDRNRGGIALVPWGGLVPAALIIAMAVGVNLLCDSLTRQHTRSETTAGVTE